MEMKKLKTVQPRMQGYTGILGMVRFTDGLSDEYLPRHIRDRMAAAMEFVEIDQDGNEQPAGAQHRLIRGNQSSIVLEETPRQTDAEKAAEASQLAIAKSKVPVLATKEELEAIASASGIKGLREVGNKWGVKHRAIPTLIAMILDAQEKAMALRNKKLAAVTQAEPAAETPVVEVVVVDEVVSEETSGAAAKIADALKAAAATGDLSAALSEGAKD